jgi:hypothetical protein
VSTKGFKQFFPFSIVLLLLMGPTITVRAQTRPSREELAKVGGELSSLYKEYLREGVSGARRFSQGRHIHLEQDSVEVVLEFPEGQSVDASGTRALGGQPGHHYRNRLLAKVPLSKLSALSKGLPGLVRVRLPYYPMELVESEGVDIMGANDYHLLGRTGLGVKVAIIDLGFGQLSSAQTAGEVPTNVTTVDYTGTGIGGNKHGTAVAEVVHDMAPDAELYLLKIDNDVDLGNAKDYCISNGIRVINHSVAWFGTGFDDGTGPICDIANNAYDNGILWVNAAGNYGNTHYQATMTDSNGDKKHEFAPGDEALSFHANAGATIEIIMDWDAYPYTYDDYDLYLYDVDPDVNPGASPKASSQNSQSPPFHNPPYEDLVYSAPATGTYYLVIQKKSTGDGNHPLSVFFFSASSLEYLNHESSLAQPADAAGVLAAGAVNLSDNLRGYSSRGPTNDGRIKPDVTATDGVSNYIYGTFSGTSASSPHTAGAAALLLEEAPALTVDQLMTKLESGTIDLGSGGKDNLFGAGRISLDADGDGLVHDLEIQYGTDPLVQDTDGDGLSDGDEVLQYSTDPLQADTDGDGLSDGEEVLQYSTDPLQADTDGDGLSDPNEIQLYGTDPTLWDSDGDSFSDGEEIAGFSDPLNPQSVPQAGMGDIAPHGNPDGVVNVADAMLAMRIATGLVTPTSFDLARGDVYPLGNPDGVINVSDVLLIMRKAAGLLN